MTGLVFAWMIFSIFQTPSSIAGFCEQKEGSSPFLLLQNPKPNCQQAIQPGICIIDLKCDQDFRWKDRLPPQQVVCAANPSNKSCPLPDDCLKGDLYLGTAETHPSQVAIAAKDKKIVNVNAIDQKFHGNLISLSTRSTGGCSESDAFEKICVLRGAKGIRKTETWIDTNWSQTTYICRESQCGDLESCEQDTGWHVGEVSGLMTKSEDEIRFPATSASVRPADTQSESSAGSAK